MNDIEEVFNFLSEWRSSDDLKKEFALSQTSSYHLIKWLKKGNFLLICKANRIGFEDNRKIYYKVKK
jgi:hypothetical protein